MRCAICGNTDANHGMIGGHDFTYPAQADVEIRDRS